MSTSENFEELQQRIEELEHRLAEAESRPVLKCDELHIVDSKGTAVITLSVNEGGSGEIRVKSAKGLSGVHICGEDYKGSGFLEVFKNFTEILDPYIVPRKDAVYLEIADEGLGGGGELRTERNHGYSVALGSRYGYGGFVSISGESDSAVSGESDSSERVLLGVDRETDTGVILLKAVKTAEDPEDDPNDLSADGLKTMAKLGQGAPPAYRSHDDGNT